MATDLMDWTLEY